jgi:hypothetical protein
VQGRNPTITGLLLLPYLAGLVLVGIVFEHVLQLSTHLLSMLRIPSLSPKRLTLHLGCTLFILGNILVATISTRTPTFGLAFILVVFGVGSGMVLQTSFILAQSAVDEAGECFIPVSFIGPPSAFQTLFFLIHAFDLQN